MVSLRYVKIKLNRLLTGRGMLLLVPIVWVCVLLYSSRMADISARSSLHLRRPQRSFLHNKPNHRSGSKDKENNIQKKGSKHHQPVHNQSGGIAAEAKKNHLSMPKDENANGIALLKRVGFFGNAKRRKSPPAQKHRPNIAASKKTFRTEGQVMNKLLPMNSNRIKPDHPKNVLHFKPSGVGEQTDKELPIPIVRDLDYTEVQWPNHGRGRQPILPGFRADTPKMGEWGRPVQLKYETLSTLERAKYDAGWANHKFNEYVSSLISIERDVPDYRPSECHNQRVSHNLPKASIIICFYNEAWTVLQRTIHSVFRRSPPELISEVILVDDFSDMVMMQDPLEEYVGTIAKLRLLRMTKRSGLVRARLAGIKEAVGPVVVFLDSHVECEEGWLPPLLDVISKHPDMAVTPGIDVIDHKTFSFGDALGNIGGMDFEGLVFSWMPMLSRLVANRTSEADVIVSPTMAGGLFAIDKQFFLKLGTYDPGLQLWGGENIELSLKLWMCGGGIVIHPCSRVAHIFRETSPYLTGKTVNVVVKNSARVAQVWLDDYKKFYFQVPYNESVYGNVEGQLQLRQRLKCKSFGWYLEYVYPELYIEGSGLYLGKIMSSNGFCIHEGPPERRRDLTLTDCALAMRWELTRMKEIRSKSLCMEKRRSSVVSASCYSQQVFQYTKSKQIYHPSSDSCLDVRMYSGAPAALVFQKCTGSNSQIWKWPTNPHYVPYREIHLTGG